MKQFIETIKILDGKTQHLEWHQRRVDATLQHFYSARHPTWDLEECISVPEQVSSGLVRCRIQYDAHHFEIHFYPYQPKTISSLLVVELPERTDYRFKYADRNLLDGLFEKRGIANDILMTRHGWITDTSIANIAFLKNEMWYTPSVPLLAGTTWKRLVFEKKLVPRPIHLRDLSLFDCYKVFNALNDFENTPESGIENINYHG